MDCIWVYGERDEVIKGIKGFLHEKGYAVRESVCGRFHTFRLGIFRSLNAIYYYSDRAAYICGPKNILSQLENYMSMRGFRVSREYIETGHEYLDRHLDEAAKELLEANILYDKVRRSRKMLKVYTTLAIASLLMSLIPSMAPMGVIAFVTLILLFIPHYKYAPASPRYVYEPELIYTPILYFRYKNRFKILRQSACFKLALLPSDKKEVLKNLLAKGLCEEV